MIADFVSEPALLADGFHLNSPFLQSTVNG